jgi:hypothetical protein
MWATYRNSAAGKQIQTNNAGVLTHTGNYAFTGGENVPNDNGRRKEAERGRGEKGRRNGMGGD